MNQPGGRGGGRPSKGGSGKGHAQHRPSSGGPRKPSQAGAQALSWAVAGNANFEVVRTGAAIVASGLSLGEQLQKLSELIVEKLSLNAGGIFLHEAEGCASRHVAGSTRIELQERSGEEGSLLHTLAISDERPLGEISLVIPPGRKLSDQQEELLELLTRQVRSTLERDAAATKRLLER